MADLIKKVNIKSIFSSSVSMDNFLSPKQSFEADEPQVDQWHEDMERKRDYCHINIFPENKKK